MAEAPTPRRATRRYRLPSRDRSLPVIQEHDCVVALRALGEDTRVRIVALLMHERLEVGEISKQLAVSPYNVSKHLRILREAGLLDVRKDGRKHLYALPEAIRRRAAAGSVLDLGCCSFQFQGATKDESRPSGPASRETGQATRKPRTVHALKVSASE